MAGSSGLAIPGLQSRRGSWRLCVFLFLTLIQIVTGNQGSIVGSCPCDLKLSGSPTTTQWQLLTTKLQRYEKCHNYIRFRLPRITLCSSSENPWVQKLRTCFDNHECGLARIYQSVNQGPQDDYPTTSIQGPNLTEMDHSLSFTTTDPFSQTNLSTRTQPKRMRNDSTSALLENSIKNLKWAAKKGQVEQLSTSAIIAILCLLVIVFVLTGVLAYFWCRKPGAVESPMQHPKGFELIISETNLPDSLI
ncbi:C-X-C motif chemokine 16 [Sminthopsis crassicaudata]|uniref:C-X-C motif chemokine 16 n=1 Tax=Sminthopsis crassicaudata TaxID=9301 RepID=UPI003D685E67